jgi:hypothetical protein
VNLSNFMTKNYPPIWIAKPAARIVTSRCPPTLGRVASASGVKPNSARRLARIEFQSSSEGLGCSRERRAAPASACVA